MNLRFINLRFINLRFIDLRFIKLKWKKVTYSLICVKNLYDGNVGSTKPVKVLHEQKLVY